jgi:hypothetical protein
MLNHKNVISLCLNILLITLNIKKRNYIFLESLSPNLLPHLDDYFCIFYLFIHSRGFLISCMGKRNIISIGLNE